ncbi:aminotransferase class I/II-fold pyridoxal phosphate-dependent enzyme [uncultured Rubinisphaera sp.]|uniref:DegT/DnrJ/EryC1/StrS family aminotransferase n=1 Tax=uncultured Rubinisphaera sp. TaxID=1678686 RepID=UPI0030D9A658|tara:strand:- start:3169 stop:4368 length:1200 start_codon:yes stop_codon:yes gene_type:complete
MSTIPTITRFEKEFTLQEPIPESGIERVAELLRSGRLHRYNSEPSEVSLLEQEFASDIGKRYCIGVNSCGSAIFLSLKAIGVTSESTVLCNAFTLAPVPGAIEHTGAKCVLVEIGKDYTIDLGDLAKKLRTSNACCLLLSHMRGHIANLNEVTELCDAHKTVLIEDAAHVAGCHWDNKAVGTFGTTGCFSTQTYKHINSGEGGLVITDNDEIAAKIILMSGSYMNYENHLSRPPLEVFEKHRDLMPNYSMRMSNLQAALIRTQLETLEDRCLRWNQRHDLIVSHLRKKPQLYLPERNPLEGYVGSSIQFSIPNADSQQCDQFVNHCKDLGVVLSWYGRTRSLGFTSRFDNWEFWPDRTKLPSTENILDTLFDFRIPLTFSLEDCQHIAQIITNVIDETF